MHSNNFNKMLVYYIMIKEKITENKKVYYKNYRFKNRDKINEYQRKYYLGNKNKNNVIKDNIKKDVQKLKENFCLLHGYSEYDDIDVIIIVLPN